MNEHIIEYCKDYILNDLTPDFAILLKGKWGCGKTYLVQDIIIDNLIDKKKIKRNDIIQISLYGISSIQELNEKMYQAIHPILSSPQVQFAGTFIRSALRLGTNIDFNSDGKNDGVLTIGGHDKKNKVKLEKIKRTLIIIDDLERCELNNTVIFGYFSEMVIKNGMKAIFIGNEEEVKPDEGKEKDKYLKIKEKIIGIEFTVSPDLENAINSFITELNFGYKKELIVESCVSVIKFLKYENLRNVRQCFYNLNILLSILPKDIDDNYLNELFSIYITLFLQKNNNSINESNVKEAIIAFHKYRLSYQEYSKKKEEDKNFQVYFDYTSKIPLSSCWQDIIFNGDYTKEKILSVYLNDNKEDDELSRLEIVHRNWREFNSEEFKNNISLLNEEFNQLKYTHPEEIIRFSNMMFFFSKNNLIQRNIEEIKTSILNFINVNGEALKVIKGRVFWDTELSEYSADLSDIKNKLIEINKTNLRKIMKYNLEEIIKNFKRDYKLFSKQIMHLNGDGTYNGIPVLSLINIDEFFEQMINLSDTDQNLIIYSLEERYGIIYSNKPFNTDYLPDLNNLTLLQKKYFDSIGDISYNPRAFIRKKIAEDLNQLVSFVSSFQS